MPDLRFYNQEQAITVADAIALVGADLIHGAGGGAISTAADTGADDLVGAVLYSADASRLKSLEGKAFGLCFIPDKLSDLAPKGGAVATAASPRLAFARVCSALFTSKEFSRRQDHFRAESNIHETARIDATAEIGERAVIEAYVSVGPGVTIGMDAHIGAGSSISHTIIGNHARILPGARIGQAGFGFEQSEAGLERVPQLGRVVIGDHVEIGANTTVDRGALLDTIIGDGTKIDNLVQIGHNVKIGRSCVIAAQTGISGSCTIGDGVFMGGQVGLADHLDIGDGAMIAAGSGLMRDVPAGEKWGGSPARPVRDWLKETATLTKLAQNKSKKK